MTSGKTTTSEAITFVMRMAVTAANSMRRAAPTMAAVTKVAAGGNAVGQLLMTAPLGVGT
jgi:hypothetical protein